MIASPNPDFPAPGTEVGCEYRWPYYGQHPTCWLEPYKGIVLTLDDPRAWVNNLTFPDRIPGQEECTAHVQKCLEQGLLKDKVPVLWTWWDAERGSNVLWDHKLRPYAEELKAWIEARTLALTGVLR